ncbi:hypothetical protein B9Q01_06150 [Candidatus Marsarchaeota G1 archaeon OSP_D]|jgi:hypothetical protein|uniref:XACb0070 ribbon-helix-helix domain-containing protein n=2 Tax=Candidatus Marsarchaeota group 1 TaxID=2203770 RepID=A0A2R6A9C9_9ARCH|nr:MAG: hypothetical protein B9Q01_06150 [Candidatus Marsarchaeota G1 archaeon OSP_D]PSN88084.1 MAG: hypothetical protein B9Q00_06780 [Candidatus Marsarchaeota G1 archaeon OSP_C]
MMGQLNLKIDDELEREFRKVAAERFEAKKGFLKKAVEEALWEWVKKNKREGDYAERLHTHERNH